MTSLAWYPNLHHLPSIGDGSCFFHSLLVSIDPSYYNASIDRKKELAVAFRKYLAASLRIADLLETVTGDLPLYQDLPPALIAYRKESYELSLSEVDRLAAETSRLSGDAASIGRLLVDFFAFRDYIAEPRQDVGDELLLLTSKIIELDIYITTSASPATPGYMLQNPSLTLKQRDSVILFHSQHHWEPVVLVDGEAGYSVFPADHPLIRRLYSHVEECWRRVHV